LDLAPLLDLAGQPAEAHGTMQVRLDLHSEGDTPHALAAGLGGQVGLAMVNGSIDNRLMAALLGPVLRHAKLPELPARAGSTPVRCLALRVDAVQGQAEARALLLDTSLFELEGGGTMNLGEERLALWLRPLARLGGTGVIVPLRVTGPMQTPKVEVDASPAGLGGRHAGGIIIGALGGDQTIRNGEAGADHCARDLTLARFGEAGPPAPAPEKPKAPKPADLLRQFLR
jgi:hypothetical protein